MAIYLLDNSLKIEIYYDETDIEYNDNICLSIVEECPVEEKLFYADETNIYLTPEEACELSRLLQAAAAHSRSDNPCQE